MIGPDCLRGSGGKSDAVVNGPRIPRLADAETAHIADAHVHHHLRRRHHHGTDIGKRIDVGAGQPVIEPHGVRASRKGMREGVGSRRLTGNQLFQRRRVGDPLLLQRSRQRDGPPFWFSVIRFAIACGLLAMPNSSPYKSPYRTWAASSSPETSLSRTAAQLASLLGTSVMPYFYQSLSTRQSPTARSQ